MELCVVEDYEIAAWFVVWILVAPQLKHLALASVLNYGTYNKMLGIKKGKKKKPFAASLGQPKQKCATSCFAVSPVLQKIKIICDSFFWKVAWKCYKKK